MKLGFTRITSSNMLEDDVLPPQHLYGPEMSLLPVCALSFIICMIPVPHLENSKKPVSEGSFLSRHASCFFQWLSDSETNMGLVSELRVTLDENGLERLREEKALVVGTQGRFPFI